MHSVTSRGREQHIGPRQGPCPGSPSAECDQDLQAPQPSPSSPHFSPAQEQLFRDGPGIYQLSQ